MSDVPQASAAAPNALVRAWDRANRIDPRYLIAFLITLVLVAAQLRYHMLGSYDRLVISLGVCMATEALLSWFDRGKVVNLLSAYISGISLTLLLKPQGGALWPFVLGGFIAISSKYVLRYRENHLWNPTNFAVAALLLLAADRVSVLSHQFGNDITTNLVIWIFGLIIAARVGVLHITLTYVASFLVLNGARALMLGQPVLPEIAPITGPMYQLFIFFMITDPRTVVKGRRRQIVVAVLIAVAETLIRFASDKGWPLPTAFNVAPAFLALATVGPVAKWLDLRRLGRQTAIRASVLLVLAFTGAARLSAQSDPPLPRSTPEQQGISSSAILAFVQSADSVDAMNSFMLVRHGHVVAEGWWAPYDAKTPHIFYSLSKSFTSTATGLAVAEGKLSLDDQVLKFFPEDAPADPSANLRAMRVRDLLRMSAGHQTEAGLWAWSTAAPAPNERLTKLFLAHPVPFKPGTHFMYNSPATYMLSAIVQKVTGTTVLDYLRPRLFAPLGFENPTWLASPQGVTTGAFGLMGRTEEIARFGQLYLQNGMWNGKQLLPASWIAEATAMQTSNGSAPTSDWDQGYGYQFWRSRHGYRGDGAFGQYILILPEQDAVVAITSGVRNMQSVMDLVWNKLLPAMSGGTLPEDLAAQRALHARLAALRVAMPSGRPTTALATRVSRRWYELPENDRGIRAISLDLTSSAPALLVRAASGESRTPIGVGSWVRSRTGFTNGIERLLSVMPDPEVAASGAWTADSVFTLKLVAPQTPFYSTLTFRFTGERLVLDSEHNVSFGPTRLPQLEGRAAARR
jgi:CubicO group peptidase (beta-lactamase class C family)/Na+-translocating ferredoxin:NAD+ oxidoreductase RnfD subunit